MQDKSVEKIFILFYSMYFHSDNYHSDNNLKKHDVNTIVLPDLYNNKQYNFIRVYFINYIIVTNGN